MAPALVIFQISFLFGNKPNPGIRLEYFHGIVKSIKRVWKLVHCSFWETNTFKKKNQRISRVLLLETFSSGVSMYRKG